MDNRIRTLLVIVTLLCCTLIAAATVLVFALRPPERVGLPIIGILIIIVTVFQYAIVQTVAHHEQKTRGVDYAAILDSITGGVLVLDGKDNVYILSEDARRYLGLSQDADAEGMYKNDIVRDDELLRCIDAAKHGESTITEYTALGVTLRVLIDPVIFDRKIVGTMVLFLDMGEQLSLQRMKREFTANVSHELKTPLTSISGYAEMIASGLADPKDVPDFAERIYKEAKRMLALIGDIIRLSQLDEGKESAEIEEVDMAQVADECADVLLNSAKTHMIKLNVDAQPCLVRGDRSLLTELAYNLIDNAIRYNRDGGSVDIIVRADSFTVSDTGIGIPKEHQSRVFERFYRVDKSRSKQTGGTGLGLAIVKHVAERYGAEVNLASVEGEGTTISILFRRE